VSMPTFPIRHTKRPSDLDGETNGKVPAKLLVDIGRRKSKMHHLAFRGWACLMWHAERAGFRWDLASIDPRTYAQQVLIFDGREHPASGRYLPESMWAAAGNAAFVSPVDVRTWEGERWKRRRGTAAAAVPGTSPHGWALAVDLAEAWDDGHYPPRSISEEFARWLVANDIALRCGFGWSMQSEPWHLQWFVGDDMPAFVLAWEGTPTDPQPEPDPDPDPPAGGLELIAMYQIALTYAPGTLVCRVTADELIHEVDADAAAVDLRAGVHREPVGWEEFVAMCRSRRTVGDPFVGDWYDENLANAWAAART
jgi:hypothetical protein